jgi:endonuclease YncB( thermonuclease family)
LFQQSSRSPTALIATKGTRPMVRSCFVLVLASVLSLPAHAESLLNGKVSAIADGDTIHFIPKDKETQQGKLKVRLVGIDTPELHLQVPGGTVSQGPIAQQAMDALAQMTPIESQIQLETVGLDNHGRTLGRIFKAKQDVNLEMVRSGMAYSYIICSAEDCNDTFLTRHRVSDYLAACQHALDSKLGIFHPKSGLKELPFQFRLREQKRQPDKWVGSYSNRVYYAPADYNKVAPCDRVFFTKAEEADALGFKPAH